MFGKNEVASKDQQADGSLIVNSIFDTMQGEGPDAGTPAVFIRLAKCNLRCFFCDTEFERGDRMPVETIVPTVRAFKRGLVVITGGEPLLQNIIPLVRMLNGWGIRVSVETAGTVWCDGLEEVFGGRTKNKIICSPKTPRLNDKLIPYISALKYVVQADSVSPDDGLPVMSTQLLGEEARIYRPSLMQRCTIPIYVQPMDEGDTCANYRNALTAARLCMEYGYHLSIQLHKLVDLP